MINIPIWVFILLIVASVPVALFVLMALFMAVVMLVGAFLPEEENKNEKKNTP